MLKLLIKHFIFLIIILLQSCTPLKPSSHDSVLIPTYFVTQQLNTLDKHLMKLSSDEMAGRKFNSTESIKVQNYLISSLINNDVTPFQGNFRHTFEHNSFLADKTGSNIIGYIQGSHYPDEFIVISAHYDHLGKIGSRIYNGADDNASGVAALLFFAQIISKKPLKHSVMFLFTDGEEINLLGAKAFIQQQTLFLPQIKLNVNIDMIAGSQKTTSLYYIENRLEKVLHEKSFNNLTLLTKNLPLPVKNGFKRASSRSVERHLWLNASDHAAFNRSHIPFIYFGVGTHINYHTTHDTFEELNLPFYHQACHAIFHYLVFFDDNII